ncbi:MAG: OadG family transporter subunit [Fusobacteriaceae bacterium]
MTNNMFGGTGAISLGDSLYITFISMCIVFFVLILLAIILSLFKYIPAEKVEIKKSDSKTKSPVVISETKSFKPEDIKDEKMMVAMMVASIEAASEDENAYIKVLSIKELN